MTTKKIKLTQNKEALVDDADYERVVQHKWWVHKGHNTWYAESRIDGRTVRLHRFITGMEPGDRRHVDHKNHDGLDNRRKNLRIVTNQENHFNMRTKGYYRFKGKYRAMIMVNGGRLSLGVWPTSKQAREAYLRAKKIYHRIGEAA